MGLFQPSFRNLYILVVVDYVSKAVVKFLQMNIFIRFYTPKAIINNEGTHFCNKMFAAALAKYRIKHKIATTYHP